MHAYLFIGSEISNLKLEISNLAKKLSAKTIEYPVAKIEDVRNLNDFLKLSFETPTLIVCTNIHEAGEEALNAFLKNLEEPQENIFFALTATSLKKVLPTIASRCEIVRVKGEKLDPENIKEIENFLKMTTGERLTYVDKIRDREKAIEFAENTVFFMHRNLQKYGIKGNINERSIRLAVKTLSGLCAYGNVNLQLSNFVINFD